MPLIGYPVGQFAANSAFWGRQQGTATDTNQLGSGYAERPVEGERDAA